MTKTKIEYVDYTWNPIKGYCPNNCSYCYAHRMYDRFGWDKNVRFDTIELNRVHKLKKSSRIFVGSTIDMYHDLIRQEWVRTIIETSKFHPEHTFITLTKFPENLYKFDFPENWWVGVTIDSFSLRGTKLYLNKTVTGKKFISFEPLLNNLRNVGFMWADWIIIGGLTPKPVHKKEWIDSIVKTADCLNIPVFIKSNAHYPIKRQEYPG